MNENFLSKFVDKTSRSYLEKYGLRNFLNCYIVKTPLNRIVGLSLDLMSEGQITDFMKKYNIDDLYHVFLMFEYPDGSKILLEKNEVIIIKKYVEEKNFIKTKINFTQKVNMYEMLYNAYKNFGDNIFIYKALNQNCFIFALSVIKPYVNTLEFKNLMDKYYIDFSPLKNNISKDKIELLNIITDGVRHIANIRQKGIHAEGITKKAKKGGSDLWKIKDKNLLKKIEKTYEHLKIKYGSNVVDNIFIDFVDHLKKKKPLL